MRPTVEVPVGGSESPRQQGNPARGGQGFWRLVDPRSVWFSLWLVALFALEVSFHSPWAFLVLVFIGIPAFTLASAPLRPRSPLGIAATPLLLHAVAFVGIAQEDFVRVPSGLKVGPVQVREFCEPWLLVVALANAAVALWVSCSLRPSSRPFITWSRLRSRWVNRAWALALIFVALYHSDHLGELQRQYVQIVRLRSGSDSALRAYLYDFCSPQDPLRDSATRVAYHIGIEDPTLNGRLELFLADEDPYYRYAAAEVLGANRSKEPALIPRLASLLADPEPLVRQAATNALSRYSTEYPHFFGNDKEALMTSLDRPDDGVRLAAAWALGRFGDPAVVSRLLLLLVDPEPSESGRLRDVALASLVSMGQPAISPLEEASRADPSPEVRFWATLALEGIRSGRQTTRFLEEPAVGATRNPARP